MDRCSPELITLIFEFACAEDIGQTARRLGLVSTHFRALAEPIELRSIAISGIEQLRGAVARLDRTRVSSTTDDDGTQSVIVRHLFISELTKEHAILVDTEFDDGFPLGGCREFWYSAAGLKAEQFYFEHSDEFWKLATELVQKTSVGLRALVLLSSSNWLEWRGSNDLDRISSSLFNHLTINRVWRREYSCSFDRPKVLGVLSGINLPNLISLTINHNVELEFECFGDEGSLFKPPTLPAVRRLHIVSRAYTDKNIWSDYPKHAHPLLASLLSMYSSAEELILCSNDMISVEHVMRAIFSPDWRVMLSTGKLPRNLRSVVLQQGMQKSLTLGYAVYQENVRKFVDDVEVLNIPGLVAQLPSDMFPMAGEREYELLFTEWEEECLRKQS